MVKFEKKKDQILAEKRVFNEPVELENCENCQLIDCEFTSNVSGEAMLYLDDCIKCKILRPKIHGKSTVGVGLKIDGAKSKDNQIIDGEWWDMTFSADNGGEPVRLGNSRNSHCFFDTIMRGCVFKELAADEETISIKSCGNLIEKCKQIDCKSSFVIRHGHTNTIRDCEFIGEGGIRVYGKDNRIENNIHRDNKTGDHPPLTLVSGDTQYDPNRNVPLDEEGKGHATYTQVINNHIINNVYNNCYRDVVWGRDNRQYKPQGVKYISNHCLADKMACNVIDFSGGATAAGNVFEDNTYEGNKVRPIPASIKPGFKAGKDETPDPGTAPDPEPEAPITGQPTDDEVPSQPEPDPVTEPAQKPPTHGRLCQCCGEEEAKVRQAIYTCPEDTAIAKLFLDDAYKNLKAKIKSGEIKLPSQEHRRQK